MGSLSRGVCFADENAAVDDWISYTPVVAGTPPLSAINLGGGIILFRPIGGGGAVGNIALPYCDPADVPTDWRNLSATDGALVAAAIASVWIAAAVFRWLIRSLKDNDNE